MKFNVVTVNYNSSHETVMMLESLVSELNYINKIIIVDNSSDKKNVDLLKDNNVLNEQSSIVSLIFLDENIGYFPALNVGLSHLDDSDKNNEYTIICNNDLVFNHEFFSRLLDSSYPEHTFAISPSVKTINGVYQNPSMAKKPSKTRLFFYSVYYSNYHVGKLLLKIWRKLGFGIDSNTKKDLQKREIFIGIGAIYVLAPVFFNKFKCLDYPLFLYGEEAFFSHQISSAGGCIFYDPTIEVLHLESVSTKKIPSRKNYDLNAKAFEIYKDYFKK
ncbi:glycosyltransferase [Plesiomonas shigelloides]|uniref:Glycosyltransferase family 2 protein n=1 Tax=Plesiomonas shigelloides TaxID=703 RepID=A0A4D6U793_PLESH|nr:glycosyltransferase [Plesiomonas shigelloides]KAB7698587.1 glycosyltransferase [Plesiomonas shigelloides]QCH03116.1 glycosyltransferase family 2 protein [Plesiomonas shigelloides]